MQTVGLFWSENFLYYSVFSYQRTAEHLEFWIAFYFSVSFFLEENNGSLIWVKIKIETKIDDQNFIENVFE